MNGGAIVKAKMYRRGASVAPGADRNLPWRAASTVAVLTILARMAFPTRRSGGLEDETFRIRISSLLETLLGLVCLESWDMHLCMDTSAQVLPWPCLPQGRVPLTLRVLDGVVQWPSVDERHWYAASPRVWLDAGRIGPMARTTAFGLVVALASRGASVERFLHQVLSQAGRMIDRVSNVPGPQGIAHGGDQHCLGEGALVHNLCFRPDACRHSRRP